MPCGFDIYNETFYDSAVSSHSIEPSPGEIGEICVCPCFSQGENSSYFW